MAEEWDAETLAFAHRTAGPARSGADPAGGSPPAADAAAFSGLPGTAEPLRAG